MPEPEPPSDLLTMQMPLCQGPVPECDLWVSADFRPDLATWFAALGRRA